MKPGTARVTRAAEPLVAVQEPDDAALILGEILPNLLPAIVVLLVVPFAIITGRLAARFGHRPFLVGGSLIYAASGLWLLLVPGTQREYLTHWLPGLLLSGISVGMVLPSLSAAAVNRLPADQYAVGSAVNQATRQIGSVLGVAITVLLLGHAGVQRAGDCTGARLSREKPVRVQNKRTSHAADCA